MKLRTKLILAQSPLAVALALVGVVSGTVTTRLGEQTGHILADNYRSVLAAQRTKESLERIDSHALLVLAGHQAELGAGRYRTELDNELRAQEKNITESGEANATARLTSSWTTYKEVLDRFEAAPSVAERDQIYRRDLGPAFQQVKRGADDLLAINQDAMSRKSEEAQRSAERFKHLVTAAVILAALFGLAASGTLTARLLRPLGVVGAAVRRFGAGDVKARAYLQGPDEIAQLAAEFNAMADHLERYRASSLGDLVRAQQAAQAAIDGLPDPVVILDAEGKVQGVNEAAGSVLRIDADAPAGQQFKDVDIAVQALLDRLRAHVIASRAPYVPAGFEEALRIETMGAERMFLPRATPMYGEAGIVGGAAVVLQDITRLFQFDELKNNLVATVAHEFRTPLTSLRMAIDLCAEQSVGPLTAKQQGLLFAARDDCERLQAIVDDVLNLSRIESGRIDLNKLAVQPADLIDQAIDVHRGSAEQKQVTIHAEISTGCPEVFADPDRLQLVFTNLLSNAIRYSPEGADITMQARANGHSVRFDVSDRGAGIPVEHQAGLFEKFFRVPGSPAGGAGLGLFIARGIVQAHGGEIGVLASAGSGTTFWFTVPAASDG
ncbi:MAG TPA: ATP-binding protein [Polyangia bacterium]|nr:ATP-binding protein [Polyangia bacterium]